MSDAALREALRGTLSSNERVLNGATEQLNAWREQPGFCSALWVRGIRK
jgi:hypothetical protein